MNNWEQNNKSSSDEKLPASATAGREPSQFQEAKIPGISLPKGGGAIKGIGETFQPNPFTGTASMSIPIYTSPGRSGFSPELVLSYGSGSGNGTFGLGWGLSIPSITRKTEKGLPQYLDHNESDTFILSGAEDLVPALKEENGNWVGLDEPDDDTGTYKIKRYCPRTEGLFARIERWTRNRDGDVHWRSITRENITSVYGFTTEARITDESGKKIFSWLLEQTFDDKGNLIIYEYKKENRLYRNDNEEIEYNVSSFLYEKNRKDATNTYIKTIYYGNIRPVSGLYYQSLDYDIDSDGFYFKVVFDYGEHKRNYQDKDETPGWEGEKSWLLRKDSFSSYRSGFEIRTRRLCRHVLMFHHFPHEGLNNQLVRSTDFSYEETPELTRLLSATQTGYSGDNKKSLPPLEFDYSKTPINFKEGYIDEPIQEADPESLDNVPQGLSGPYRFIDLNGEGIAGILTDQAEAWHYKPPLGRIDKGDKKAVLSFAPVDTLSHLPSRSSLRTQQIMDLDGNGFKEIVQFRRPVPGYVEREDDKAWSTFCPFDFLPNIDWQNPNLQFIDLNGDGHADILIAGDDYFTWYPSLKKEGFGEAHYLQKPKDDEKGPALVFSDGTGSIHLADMSGDGLSDIVRIQNRSVVYWPNMGYGRFGTKICMGNAPSFTNDTEFRQDRIRLFDTDGSGTADIIYIGSDGATLYLNQAGNGFRDGIKIQRMPVTDNQTSVQVTDLHGNGTGCLTWSSPQSDRILYIDLMQGRKPHLLVNVKNNLGAETRITYASSTKYYLKDKAAGKPWITKLPFPVYVVERTETYDWVSKNRFVTHYAYHHGYFDGIEREFRGFGMVEQWDTEEYTSLAPGSTFPEITNSDKASHVPPVYTKTWYHTGAYFENKKISTQYEKEYFGFPNPAAPDYDTALENFKKTLIPDTILDAEIPAPEIPQACRALRGSVLRQEVFADDETPSSFNPYMVSEQSYTIVQNQPAGENKYGVFFVHPREAITFHYERDPSDPRISHRMTLKVDEYGNPERQVAINYPRLPVPERRDEQAETHMVFTVNRFTQVTDHEHKYRIGLPVETQTFEIVKPPLPTITTTATGLFPFDDIRDLTENLFPLNSEEPPSAHTVPYEEWNWREITSPDQETKLRLIEHVRTVYRRNDLTGPMDLGDAEFLALPYESYKLAFTQGLLTGIFGNNRIDDQDQLLHAEGGYVRFDNDDKWWIPSGKIFFYEVFDNSYSEVDELHYAQQHFFLPCRFLNPFGYNAFVRYDRYDLLTIETEDALQNKVTVGNRDTSNSRTDNGNNYRVLQPSLVTDPNRNRSRAVFDALGMVVGTAIMGKVGEDKGDLLDDTFTIDPDAQDIMDFFNNPYGEAEAMLANASTRIIYDLDQFRSYGQPVFAATLARETHYYPVLPGEHKIQIGFTYSDGFGREIQKKIQAEPGPVPERDSENRIIVGPDRTPVMTTHDAPHRWVGSGWTIFNNKGKPIKQFEPFFSDTYQFDNDVQIGFSPTLFYDPVGRVVATLHPNHTYEKVFFDPWYSKTWDVNDTVLQDNPGNDPDAGSYFRKLDPSEYLPTWYAQREAGAMGIHEQNAAAKAFLHAETPTMAFLDSLGRPFLTIAKNKFEKDDGSGNTIDVEEEYPTRMKLDIEGNQREIIDAHDRIVMRYDYSIAGPEQDENGQTKNTNLIHQASMEAGERWILNDIAGQPIHAWDNRGHHFKTAYDPLRRPVQQSVLGSDPVHSDPRTLNGNEFIVIGKTEYGEGQADAIALNLCTRVFRQYDSSGIITSKDFNPETGEEEAYDFKGNLLRSSRQLVQDYKALPNWSGPVALATDIYHSSTAYDALNRPIIITSPDNSIIRPVYNEANLLEQMMVNIRGEQQNNNPIWTSFVTDIDYDARGRRTYIDYGNEARTTYAYDPLTSRLTRLQTVRGNKTESDCTPDLSPRTCIDPPDPCPGLQSSKCILQDLSYTYDPVGNITYIRDDAQQVIYFHNRRVEPSTDYTYDAVYRLIKATGREHLGQTNIPTPHSYNDTPRINIPHPGDGNAMGTYTEHFLYDAVGNFREIRHSGHSPIPSTWSRMYTYNETSLIEDGTNNMPLRMSNRLTSTTVNTTEEFYSVDGDGYDPHGNMLKMPQLNIMQWDFNNQLYMTQRQAVNALDSEGQQRQGERTYYVYDASGQRVRKVTELENGSLKEERIYLGGYEIYRKHSGPDAGLVRETLHIMDGQQRIALVETRTQGTEPGPPQVIRYQFGNHLGSASLEMDADGKIISYEEYYPYGGTSYQAVRRNTEVPQKRYRYSGKERDEESGLYYYGARYYACWLGRWTACDPAGLVDSLDLYQFCKNSPATNSDWEGFLVNSPKCIYTQVTPSPIDTKLEVEKPKKQELPTHWTKILKDRILNMKEPELEIVYGKADFTLNFDRFSYKYSLFGEEGLKIVAPDFKILRTELTNKIDKIKYSSGFETIIGAFKENQIAYSNIGWSTTKGYFELAIRFGKRKSQPLLEFSVKGGNKTQTVKGGMGAQEGEGIVKLSYSVENYKFKAEIAEGMKGPRFQLTFSLNDPDLSLFRISEYYIKGVEKTWSSLRNDFDIIENIRTEKIIPFFKSEEWLESDKLYKSQKESGENLYKNMTSKNSIGAKISLNWQQDTGWVPYIGLHYMW